MDTFPSGMYVQGVKTSPFPGLDPYLEPFWSGVHTRMASLLCNQIQSQLPEGLWADVEETVTVSGEANDGLHLRPDVGVFDQGSQVPDGSGESGDLLTIAEPLVIAEPLEVTERTVVIVDTTSGDRVVTAIEMLSPANKVGVKGRIRYTTRRDAYINGNANLVEIDLLRSGEHIVGAPEYRIPANCPSLISVWRQATLRFELYAIPLADPLPNFRVPLRPGDQDVILRLQEAFDENYRQGAYPRRIDYTKDPVPKLSEKDASWAKDFIAGERNLIGRNGKERRFSANGKRMGANYANSAHFLSNRAVENYFKGGPPSFNVAI